MLSRDRRFALALLAIAGVAWAVVAYVATTVDPRADPESGFVGAGVLGVATAATVAPVFWLLSFAWHRRIAYRGDWQRAIRRGAWVGLLVAVFVVMRINGVFQPPIALFLAALALVAEVTLSRQ
ncbi:MAG TPA: hypothetical protein VNL94_02265 [Candidatus Binatia bacterium]|nr:hypothetical protein [Candidatus Binatia bacterium]